MPGTIGVQPAAGNLKSAGAAPTLTAMACSSVARVRSRPARPRVHLERLRLQHVGLGDDAGLVAVARDLQAALVALERDLEQCGSASVSRSGR